MPRNKRKTPVATSSFSVFPPAMAIPFDDNFGPLAAAAAAASIANERKHFCHPSVASGQSPLLPFIISMATSLVDALMTLAESGCMKGEDSDTNNSGGSRLKSAYRRRREKRHFRMPGNQPPSAAAIPSSGSEGCCSSCLLQTSVPQQHMVPLAPFTNYSPPAPQPFFSAPPPAATATAVTVAPAERAPLYGAGAKNPSHTHVGANGSGSGSGNEASAARAPPTASNTPPHGSPPPDAGYYKPDKPSPVANNSIVTQSSVYTQPSWADIVRNSGQENDEPDAADATPSGETFDQPQHDWIIKRERRGRRRRRRNAPVI